MRAISRLTTLLQHPSETKILTLNARNNSTICREHGYIDMNRVPNWSVYWYHLIIEAFIYLHQC